MKLESLHEISIDVWERFYLAIDDQSSKEPFMWNSTKIRDWLGHSLANGTTLSKTMASEVWLQLQLGEIASFVVVQRVEPVVEILFLTTLTKFQRTGTMKSLLVEIFETVSKDGQMWLEVHEKNLKGVSLYEKSGMKRVGKRPAYYRDGGAALLYGMSKSLP